MKPVLVIMAAGLGSRYGGLKQLDKIGPNGEIILELSVYDAIRAGFEKVVFILRDEIKYEFKKLIGNKLEKFVDVKYVIQDNNILPNGYRMPEGRIKPWGTAHAILCTKNVVKEPFVVINSDDFYGREAFKSIYDFLVANSDENNYGMIGYTLSNTLSENGHVARGICEVENGYLKKVVERTKIVKKGEDAFYIEDEKKWIELDCNSIVSMNMWAFNNNIFNEIENGFKEFLDREVKVNPLKSEYYIPSVVSSLLDKNKITVKIIPSQERWYGVTYKEDKILVKAAIERLIKDGIYTDNLWEEVEEKCIMHI